MKLNRTGATFIGKKNMVCVIQVSACHESFRPAIHSVINSHTYFCEVHIEREQTPPNEYPGWDEDREELKKLGIEVTFHSVLDPNRFSPQGTISFKTPATVQFTSATLVRGANDDNWEKYDVIEIPACIAMSGDKLPSLLQLPGIFLWHPFLMVCVFLSWSCRNVKFERIMKTAWGVDFMPPRSRRHHKVLRHLRGNHCQDFPDPQDVNGKMAIQMIKDHTLSWPQLFLFFLHYALLAIPWWVVPISTWLGAESLFVKHPGVAAIVQRDIIGILFNWITIPQTILVYVVFTSRSMSLPLGYLHLMSIIYPLILTLYPFMWIIFQFYTPSGAWARVNKQKVN